MALLRTQQLMSAEVDAITVEECSEFSQWHLARCLCLKGMCYDMLMSAALQFSLSVLQPDKLDLKHLPIPQVAQ